jgi:prepilin-type N-terminal cleavage/methylation domain-containing protein
MKTKNIIRFKNTSGKSKRAFTLVELLVVITIIAILVGLAVPAVTGALAKAKQMGDTANARSLGQIFFAIASEESGYFPTGGIQDDGNRMEAQDSVSFFNSMIASDELREPKVVWSMTGKAPAQFSQLNPNLKPENLAFEYISGLTQNDKPIVPILVSRGAVRSMDDFTKPMKLSANNVWRNDGYVVCTLGMSAQFIKANKGRMQRLYEAEYAQIPDSARLLPAGGGRAGDIGSSSSGSGEKSSGMDSFEELN